MTCRYCRATRQAHIRGCPNVNGTAARYAVTIGNADGSRSRTVHLYAANAADAIARGNRWTEREGLRGYTATGAAPMPL